MPTAIILNGLIHNQNISKTCKSSLKKFEKEIAILDNDFSIKRIPFAQWHCGWAYGDVGRVILRLFASIATPNFAMNFNHACAIQRDCYMSRKQRTTCDRMFKNSIQGIVNSLKRNKKGSEEFNEILIELSDWKSEYAYSIANLTESSYRTYSGSEGPFNEFNYHEPMNKTAVVFMELNVAENIKKELDKLYPHCKFHKSEISSCFNNYMNSYEDLSKCLSNIEDVQCTHQIQKAEQALEPKEENQSMWGRFKDFKNIYRHLSSIMQNFAIGLFIFYLSITDGLDPKTYEVPIPVLTDCPFASSILDFCVSDFNFCVNNKSGFPICSSQFCACIKKELPQKEQRCRANITDTCRLLTSRKSPHKVEYSSFEWPEEIISVNTEIRKSCGLKELDSSELSIQHFVQLISDNQCIQNNRTMIDTSSMIVDENTNIGVPFDRFRCGWQYGDIGIVLARYWIANACGPYSVNFNHCCAKHLNCYMNQFEKEFCDEECNRCRTSLVSRMVSHKESCRALASMNNHELFNVKISVYESLQNTKIPTVISSFDGNLKQSFSGPSNLNFSLIKVFKLSSDEQLDIEIGDSFYQEIYKNGWSNRVFIDSSALIFEDCRKHNSIILCLKQLVFSISEIDGKMEEFDVAIRKFNETIASRNVAPLTKSEVDEMISNLDNGRVWDIIIMIVVDILIVLIAKYDKKIWKISKRIYYYFFSNKTPTQNVLDPAEIPLGPVGPVSELNGSTTFSEDSGTVMVNHPVPE
ncbi:hypothetical protein B9Z55_019603 [Caenorhabditis nigoni]|nr:hypothetical protein B9Z55_019603 [Caenorhabditis nigoni]